MKKLKKLAARKGPSAIWYAIAAIPSSAKRPRAMRSAVRWVGDSSGSGYARAARWNGAVARPASVQMTWSRPGPTLMIAIGTPTHSAM